MQSFAKFECPNREMEAYGPDGILKLQNYC